MDKQEGRELTGCLVRCKSDDNDSQRDGLGEGRMKERPILFGREMVRAIIDGRKTQTRRVIKTNHVMNVTHYQNKDSDRSIWKPYCGQVGGVPERKCPYGEIGDQLWVRETFKVGAWRDEGTKPPRIACDYKASPELVNTPWCYPTVQEYTKKILKVVNELDKKGIEPEEGGAKRIYHWEPGKSPLNWRPSIFMPRWASRIQLEITDVRVERVQDITANDIVAEGCLRENTEINKALGIWITLWNSINEGHGYGWNVNPWVWVVEFKREDTELKK